MRRRGWTYPVIYRKRVKDEEVWTSAMKNVRKEGTIEKERWMKRKKEGGIRKELMNVM